MGRIAKILSFLRVIRRNANLTDVKINQNGGNNITCEHFSDIGDDSYPLDTDYVYVSPTDRSGGNVAIGYLDPLTTKKANAGDKRIYARESNGNTICEIWLKNDGTILTSNNNGNIELKPNGESVYTGPKFIINADETEINSNTIINGLLDVNGATIKHNGTDVGDNHFHTQGDDSNGDSEEDTSTPTS